MDSLITQLPRVDALFDHYADRFGPDQTAYRNHVYRLINLVVAQGELDTQEMEKLQIAGFFHDAGIWLAGTFDYLPPSARLANHYLQEQGLTAWQAQVEAMIINHHKISRCPDPTSLTERFRRADWADLSLGLLHGGIDRRRIRQIQKRFANAGFHRLLLKKAGRHLLAHPLRPLPMLRR